MISKKEVLDNLEKVKEYIFEIESKKEEVVKYIEIKNRFTGSVIWKSTKTTFKDAVIEAVNTNANLTRADLTHADLNHADLSGANLSGANLIDADLTHADLAGANLTACKYYMGSSNRNFEALCKAIKTIRWNDKTGSDFIS